MNNHIKEEKKTDQKVLVTGAAGFIGFHLCQKLLNLGYNVVGLDNINDYYNVGLKYDRLQELGIRKKEASIFINKTTSDTFGKQFSFIRMNLEDSNALPKLFKKEQFDLVCNLAAQAGVRYSLENPRAYIESNINGFLNLLECCRHHNVNKLLYASSSSVYGNSTEVPFHETQNVDNPISLYAATKKSNELMAHTYSHLYGIQTIGLRFFTVYGPWGRPDMAMFLFTEAILKEKPIKVFNNGDLFRDFTYVDDIIEGIRLIVQSDEKSDSYQLYNIGNSKPVELLGFIKEIENSLSKKALMEMHPMQPGDVYKTYANVSKLKNLYGYNPKTSVEKGVDNFIQWYMKYYDVN